MPKTLYVHRPLVNTEDLLDWAVGQGFETILEPNNLHTTIAFSKSPLDWGLLTPEDNHIKVIGGPRRVGVLGDRGALVLHFEDRVLHDRWQEILDAGASWDHDGYHPHITITYKGSNIDAEIIEPYEGVLVLGPEKFSSLKEDWDKTITEIPLVVENQGVSTNKTFHAVKYRESITENNRMTALSSLLMKNIDLILEAYNVDEKGNLVVANKKKVAEADEVFHDYFVKSMNQMFRQLNEADPIMGEPDLMGNQGVDDLGLGGGMMDGMEMDAMGAGMDDPMGDDLSPFGEPSDGNPMEMMGDTMGHEQFGGGNIGGGMAAGGAMGESTDWIFDEDVDLDIDGLFNLTEEEDEEEEEEGEQLDELMMSHGDMMGDDQMGDAGMDMGMDDMGGLDSAMDHDSGMMGDDDMGGDDMVTIHGTTDQGADFEFSFDPNTLGFDDMGADMGGGDDHDMSADNHADFGDMDDGGAGEEPADDGSDFGASDEDEQNKPPVAESKKGLPKGRKSKSSRMAVVPSNPAISHAAPFPTPQGRRQKR